MYELAKSSREKMKAKARSLANEKDQKVDSSDWSPAEPLNAEAKTGMRPVSRRAYKSGGKVSGDNLAKQIVNRNVKEANESREGVKHVGGMKSGGKAARATGGGVYDKKALGKIDPRPKRGKAQHYAGGGAADKLNKLVGYKSEAQRQQENMPDPATRKGVDYGDPAMKGDRDKLDRMSAPYKKGGRTARATGGPTLDMAGMKSAAKKPAKSAKGANIKIVIATGAKEPPANVMAPPPGPAIPMPPPPGAMPPGGMPPGAGMMPPGGAPPAAPPMGRKAGGRISKVAKSYKDMEAGAASGEGRLQKTDIAKQRKDAPARKDGGRLTKVAKSYKDMEAGAGSGEGRLQKTDIAKRK
jgi:hypothetical protein